MRVAFRKSAYFPSRTEAIIETDWDLLKILMCREWNVEELFDAHCVWERLRDSETVLADGFLYFVYDELGCGPTRAVELFTGDVLQLDGDAEAQA